MKNISTTSKHLGTFCKVLQWGAAIGMIAVIAILAVLTAVSGADGSLPIGTKMSTLEIGQLSLELAEEYLPDTGSLLCCLWIYVGLGAAAAAVICVGLGYIRRILAPMAAGIPFHKDTASYFRKLAYLSLALGVIQNVGAWVETASALHVFALDRLVDSGIVRSVTANFTLELGSVVFFFVLLLMSHVFSYGTELQQLSDETL